MDKINVGVVGYGHIGKRHCAVVNDTPQTELVAVCDCNPQMLSQAPVKVNTFNHFDQLVKYKPDVIAICTPNGYHAPMAIKALEANINVIIEKPMALTDNEAAQIVTALGNSKANAFCVMQNRYSPPSKWLKEVVNSGILGEIYMVQVNCFWNRDHRYYHKNTWHGSKQLDGGTLFTQFSHFIDLIYWLFGQTENEKGSFFDFNHRNLTDFEDSGYLRFNFKNGGEGSFIFSTSCYESNLESSLTIITQNGTIKVGGQYMEKVTHCNVKNYQMPKLPNTLPPNNYGAYKGSAANHHFVYANVVSTLCHTAQPDANVFEGQAVVNIINRMYAAV